MGLLKTIGLGIIGGIKKIFKPKPPEAAPAAPDPIALPVHVSKEIEALQRAMNILIEAETHPDDATYQQARQEALVYINKSQKLANTGKTQSGNRKYIADRYLKHELSTPKGIADRKARKLAVFNSNFGFALNEKQADVVGEIMKSSSFKKLMELYRSMYDIIIGMVGDQIEAGIDPARVESTLDMWVQMGIEPNFDAFADVTNLSGEDFMALQEEVTTYNEEAVYADEFERKEAFEGILGNYIEWEE